MSSFRLMGYGYRKITLYRENRPRPFEGFKIKKQYSFITVLIYIHIDTAVFSQDLMNQGIANFKEQKYSEAQKVFEQTIKNDPLDAEAHYYLGLTLFEGSEAYRKAEKHLKKAVELLPNCAEYHYALGEVLGKHAQNAGVFRKMGLASSCKEEYEKAVVIEPNNVKYLEALARYYMYVPGIAGGSSKKAQTLAVRIKTLDPIKGHMMIVDIDMREEKYELAEIKIDSLGGVMNGNAENLEIVDRNRLENNINRLGYIYLNEKEYKKAIELFKRNVLLFPKSYNVFDSLGEAYKENGDIELAIQNYEKAARLNPRSNEYHRNVYRDELQTIKRLKGR